MAKIYGIKIYTVGMGTNRKAPFMVNTPLGPQAILRNVDLDETTLSEISKITGGRFFKATDANSLQKIYATIDELEKSEVRWIDHSEFNELFPFFLIPGMFLLLLEILTSQLLLVRIP